MHRLHVLLRAVPGRRFVVAVAACAQFALVTNNLGPPPFSSMLLLHVPPQLVRGNRLVTLGALTTRAAAAAVALCRVHLEGLARHLAPTLGARASESQRYHVDSEAVVNLFAPYVIIQAAIEDPVAAAVRAQLALEQPLSAGAAACFVAVQARALQQNAAVGARSERTCRQGFCFEYGRHIGLQSCHCSVLVWWSVWRCWKCLDLMAPNSQAFSPYFV